jgi:hypothetical protein
MSLKPLLNSFAKQDDPSISAADMSGGPTEEKF